MSDNDSLYIPTPERPLPLKASCVDLPHKMVFMDLSQLDQFVDTINKIRGCKTPRCDGALIPVNVKSSGLGGAICISYCVASVPRSMQCLKHPPSINLVR